MTDNPKLVLVQVAIWMKPSAEVQDVLADCDYSFDHEDILETEIRDIQEVQ